MPKFIPPYCGEEVKSKAEKKMYTVLQQLQLKNSYILHSLGLPRHQAKIYGEVDFVIVCDRGIACLEIKGGRVECRQGQWLFTDRYGVERKKPEGPFAQVIGNMFSLREVLKKRFEKLPHVRNMLTACGAVFPDIQFQASGQEIINEIVYDKRTEDITEYINKVFDYWQQRQHKEASLLSPADIDAIVDYLRGEFTFIPSLADRLNVVENRLVRLTSEQVQLMDALALNERLLIEGKAGTGKTLLAVDFAKKQALRGKKVLYLTYNKNLAGNVLHKVDENINLKAINIHALFGEYVDVDIELIRKEPQRYFSDILPQEFYNYISGLDTADRDRLQYDLLVMDEGQDIIKPDYLFSLDLLLAGGFERGNWAVFYDENQNIYNPDYQDGMELLQSYPCTRFRLFVNCRNTVQIGTYSANASGVNLGEFIREYGEEVQKISYHDEEDFRNRIRGILKSLQGEKIDRKEITFLSPKKYKNSMLARSGIEVSELSEYEDGSLNVPRYSTIQGFKGLDSKIVILIDVETIRDVNYSRYMYIAITRARTLLYIIGSEEYWSSRS